MFLLRNVRVLEIGQLVAVPYASKLLADLGAEVIKIEPIQGDASRRRGPYTPDAPHDLEQSGLFLGLNTNKKSVALDLTTDAGRERVAEFVAQADIVLHDLTPAAALAAGLDAGELLQRHPHLVVCAVTHFGSTGPQAEWLGEEITSVHGGGWGYLIPGDDSDLDAPPLTVFGSPASCQAAMAAAFAALGAYLKAQQTGIGEFIDQSVSAHVASMLEAAFVAWSYMGKNGRRNDGRSLTPWRIYECSDGLIFLVTVEQDQWERLVEMMGRPEWALTDLFATVQARAANQDVLNLYIEEWTRQHQVEELFHAGQQNRICFAPVFTMADLERQEHLRDRGFFTQTQHPVAGDLKMMAAPYRMTPNSWSLRSPAPLLNEHRNVSFAPRDDGDRPRDPAALERRPLEGVRVIDFSWVWAGPFCTMHLAYLGAEVIKIESSKRPGLGRRLWVHPPELEVTLNTCGYFNQWDQGKKSVELDLTDPAAIEQVLRLISEADVVVDNYATGVMDRLGLSDQVLRTANPDLIIASVTGYGHTGPLREYMGYGPTTAPLSGLTSMTGHAGGSPAEAGISLGDPAAGLTAAFAIMASLVGRHQGDDATRIDVSLWESTAANAIEGWMAHALGAELPKPMGSRHPLMAPHGMFPAAADDMVAAQDAWVAIACTSDDQWKSLAALIDPALSTDERFLTASARKQNEAALEEAVSAFTSTRSRWEVTNELQRLGVAAYPSLTCQEVELNEQLVARDFWERFDHPAVGPRTHSGVPWRTTNWPNGVTHRAPLLGEHTSDFV